MSCRRIAPPALAALALTLSVQLGFDASPVEGGAQVGLAGSF